MKEIVCRHVNKEGNQYLHSYSNNSLDGIFEKSVVYVLDLNATKILFEIQQIMLLDYELSLWNRKHVVFFTLPNHL